MSSLWVIFKKTGFNSLSRSTKGFNSLRHIRKRGFNSSSHIEKKKQFFESLWEKRFNSLSNFEKRFNSLSHFETSPILWVIFKKKDSIPRVKLKKGSILCVIFEKRDVQFCASYSRKEMFNSVRFFFFEKKILVSHFPKKKKRSIYSLSHTLCQKEIFFESN